MSSDSRAGVLGVLGVVVGTAVLTGVLLSLGSNGVTIPILFVSFAIGGLPGGLVFAIAGVSMSTRRSSGDDQSRSSSSVATADESQVEDETDEDNASPGDATEVEDVDEEFSTAIERLESASEVENTAERAIAEQDAVDDFAAAVARASDPPAEHRLETYSKVLSSEATHVDQVDVRNALDAAQSGAESTGAPSGTVEGESVVEGQSPPASTSGDTGGRRAHASGTAPATGPDTDGEPGREARPEPRFQGRTWKDAAIGAAITTVLYLVPGVNVGSPIIGGVVAGYLYRGGALGGVKVGSIIGVVMVLPAFLLGALASGLLARTPVIGDLLAGSLVVLVVIVVLHSLVLGALGGAIGGLRRTVRDLV